MKLKVFRTLNIGALCFSTVLDNSKLSDRAARRIAKRFGFSFPPKGATSFDTFDQAQNAYLEFCNVTLFNFFKLFLGDSYLFSALSFKREKESKAPVIVKGDDETTNYNIHKEVISNWEEIRDLLKKFIDEIYEEKIISLTNILIGVENPFDLFFIKSKLKYGGRIINKRAKIRVYRLNDIQFTEDFDEFLSLNESKINEFIDKVSNAKDSSAELKYALYVWNYKQLADKYSGKNSGKDFLLHFIKSSTFQSKFNILLSLATNRFLTEDELVFIDLLIHRIVSETAVEKAREIERGANEAIQHATRAAISQVLARNMSHNIGSHVSYKATNIAIKKRIVDLYPELELKTLYKNEKIVDWLDFMSEKLDKYETHRNEYLADYSLSPQSFRFYKDVILPFCENTLILDNIASMEGANYPKPVGEGNQRHFGENRLKIRVFIKKEGEKSYQEIKARYPDLTCLFSGDGGGKEIVYPDHFPYLLKNKSEKNSLSDGINSKKIEKPDLDVEVLMHSKHGLYSILENFIRNSAKHNKDKIKEIDRLEIRLHLQVEKKFPDRYSLIISDNVSELGAEKLFNKSPQNLGLYDRMKSKIVGDGEQSGKQNLGFADMNINSFLFRFNASDISNDTKTLTKNLHLVTIKSKEDKLTYHRVRKSLSGNSNYRFGYLLKLLKPRKIVWIGDDIPINGGSEKISSLKKNGIFQFENIDEYSKNTGSNGEIAAFDFVIFYKKFDAKYYLENQTHFPARVLVIDNNSKERLDKPNIRYMDNFNHIKDAEELVEECWVQWLNRIEKKKTAYIYYEENKEAEEKLENLLLGGSNEIKCVKKNSDKTIINSESIAVIYDHHGKAFEETNLERPNTKTENFYTNHSKMFFDKGSDDYVTLNSLPQDEHKKRLLAYRLIDAATTNVFILDERIATIANRDNDNANDQEIGIKFRDYDNLNFSRFCYGKVFVLNNITTDANGDKPIYSGEQNYYLSFQVNSAGVKIKIKNDFETDERKSEKISRILGEINDIKKDILVVHRTYLKKENLGLDVKDFLDLAGKTFGSVIVTSGGGYPHNLQEQVRFVPFSIIEQCISSRLSKLKLVTYLQKLRYV
jgi:hypothetical protein